MEQWMDPVAWNVRQGPQDRGCRPPGDRSMDPLGKSCVWCEGWDTPLTHPHHFAKGSCTHPFLVGKGPFGTPFVISHFFPFKHQSGASGQKLHQHTLPMSDRTARISNELVQGALALSHERIEARRGLFLYQLEQDVPTGQVKEFRMVPYQSGGKKAAFLKCFVLSHKDGKEALNVNIDQALIDKGILVQDQESGEWYPTAQQLGVVCKDNPKGNDNTCLRTA